VQDATPGEGKKNGCMLPSQSLETIRLNVDGANGFPVEQQPGEIAHTAAYLNHPPAQFTCDETTLPGEVVFSPRPFCS
jgi:hypothetical protein